MEFCDIVAGLLSSKVPCWSSHILFVHKYTVLKYDKNCDEKPRKIRLLGSECNCSQYFSTVP